MEQQQKMEKLIGLCKRRGFLFPGSEIYGGFGSSYDYGPLGVQLKMNVKNEWWRQVVQMRRDVLGLDSSIIMNPKIWEASGHVAGFTDPLTECKGCHKRYRADHLIEAAEGKQGEGMNGMRVKPVEITDLKCPACGGEFGEIRQFNCMFKTSVGSLEDGGSVAYLRPETCQGIYVNFALARESGRKKVPFGIAQIGKAFRNEITTGNFIYRTREFEQMELEFFVKPGTDEEWFNYWYNWNFSFFTGLGINPEHLRNYEHPKEKLVFYSKRTIDVEYAYPWGWGELCGCANRTDYDLKQHTKHSGQDLSYFDAETNERYTPYVIEPSFGADRATLSFLLEAYDEVDGGRAADSDKEVETVLRLHPRLAPVKVAILPLSKKEPLLGIAEDIRAKLAQRWFVQYDETGSVGRRYRRQDEIGTPWCVTIDFDTPNDGKVTVRDRDTMAQERISIEELEAYFADKLK